MENFSPNQKNNEYTNENIYNNKQPNLVSINYYIYYIYL